MRLKQNVHIQRNRKNWKSNREVREFVNER